MAALLAPCLHAQHEVISAPEPVVLTWRAPALAPRTPVLWDPTNGSRIYDTREPAGLRWLAAKGDERALRQVLVVDAMNG